MKQNRKNNGIKAAILTMSFIQMATNAVSSVLADIAAEFPAASVSAVQYLMTFPREKGREMQPVVDACFDAVTGRKWIKL